MVLGMFGSFGFSWKLYFLLLDFIKKKFKIVKYNLLMKSTGIGSTIVSGKKCNKIRINLKITTSEKPK